jgi:hypothetical protein
LTAIFNQIIPSTRSVKTSRDKHENQNDEGANKT